MDADYLTPERRRAEYDRIARVLDTARVSRTAHAASGDECGMEPLCAGPDGMELLLTEILAGPHDSEGNAKVMLLMLLVTVGELARLTGELAVATAERDDALARAMRLDADLLDAHGALATAEERLAEWDAAADVIGPVGWVDEIWAGTESNSTGWPTGGPSSKTCTIGSIQTASSAAGLEGVR